MHIWLMYTSYSYRERGGVEMDKAWVLGGYILQHQMSDMLRR